MDVVCQSVFLSACLFQTWALTETGTHGVCETGTNSLTVKQGTEGCYNTLPFHVDSVEPTLGFHPLE